MISLSLLVRRVDPEACKLPVSLLECRCVLCDKVFALSRTFELRGVDTVGPGAAEVDIRNDGLVLEVRANVAVGAREVGDRKTPSRGVGGGVVVGSEISRRRIAVEDPHANACITELHCIDLVHVSKGELCQRWYGKHLLHHHRRWLRHHMS